MSLSEQLATPQGDKSQLPNKELARKIVLAQDQEAVKEILEILNTSAGLDLIGDALKVLEVIGETDSKLAASAYVPIKKYLTHSSNKIQWRAMSALSNIAAHYTKELFLDLPQILKIMEDGTVITRDHGIKILLELYKQTEFQAEIAPLLLEQVLGAPDNQLGQYAEKWFKIISHEHIPQLITTLESRQPELEKPSHQKRLSKILLSLNKKR